MGGLGSRWEGAARCPSQRVSYSRREVLSCRCWVRCDIQISNAIQGCPIPSEGVGARQPAASEREGVVQSSPCVPPQCDREGFWGREEAVSYPDDSAILSLPYSSGF